MQGNTTPKELIMLAISAAGNSILGSKGQATIPKEIRNSLGLKTGDRMTFTLLPDGTVLLRVKNKSILDLAGMLHEEGRAVIPTTQLRFPEAKPGSASKRRT
jgi:AbrB family looped-hinge helix DNA binding protein